MSAEGVVNASELNKIASVLALLLVKDQAKGAAAFTLNACGFSHREIAALTQSSESSVRGAISKARKKLGDDG